MNGSLTATLRYALYSEKKMEILAKMVRWETATKAIEKLEFVPKKGADILQKLIKSAVANAKHNGGVKDEGSLYIKRIDVGKWEKLKRVSFVSRAWIHPYKKHRSFVRVVLDYK